MLVDSFKWAVDKTRTGLGLNWDWAGTGLESAWANMGIRIRVAGVSVQCNHMCTNDPYNLTKDEEEGGEEFISSYS